jgi:hypothetical protein
MDRRLSAAGALSRHPDEGRDLAGASGRDSEIPAFAGMTILLKTIML